MRSGNSCFPPGCFHGAEIEPGTFHGRKVEARHGRRPAPSPPGSFLRAGLKNPAAGIPTCSATSALLPASDEDHGKPPATGAQG